MCKCVMVYAIVIANKASVMLRVIRSDLYYSCYTYS